MKVNLFQSARRLGLPRGTGVEVENIPLPRLVQAGLAAKKIKLGAIDMGIPSKENTLENIEGKQIVFRADNKTIKGEVKAYYRGTINRIDKNENEAYVSLFDKDENEFTATIRLSLLKELNICEEDHPFGVLELSDEKNPTYLILPFTLRKLYKADLDRISREVEEMFKDFDFDDF